MLNDFEVFLWMNIEGQDLKNPASVYFLMDGVSSVIKKKNGLYHLAAICKEFGDAIELADSYSNGAYGIVIRREGTTLIRDHRKYTNLQDALTP